MSRRSLITVFVALTAVLLLGDAAIQARPLGGFSGGSRGLRTYTAPPSTPTAPTAAPIQRSMTQAPSAGATGLGSNAGRFGGRGLFGGFAGGFLGAGLLGLLLGYGLFGGMAGFASFFGLLLQLLVIVIVGRLIYAWWQRRNAPAMAAYAAPNVASAYGFGRSASPPNGARDPSAGEPLAIGKPDYDAFERLLGEIQAAYSAEDLAVLREKVTPEMLSYFSEDLAANASRGLVNRIAGVRLTQGDLAEAWREAQKDFATVAMRFVLTDSMVDRASGRLVEGGQESEVTELWTFMRARGGNWLLSAIQQT
jgi:predicted lipid-binding transport protein (Tim44 family)